MIAKLTEKFHTHTHTHTRMRRPNFDTSCKRGPKLGKSKVPSLKLCGSDCQGICDYEKNI